ncbi:MAG: hypothetical protein D6832_03565 [Alphaproteobacteria bacterium]|nr:MAG: hypothetical protein D6832_03565 [Alphaproteobacteria bacterium]
MKIRRFHPLAVSLTALVAMAGIAATPVLAADEEEEEAATGAAIVIPVMNAEHGRELFAEKGCVLCHKVNGIGGDDAESFDDEEFTGPINPFHLAAKMWEHAQPMIAEQQEELGEQIELSGQELADIVAFLASPELRAGFTEAMIPERIREAMKHEEEESEEEEAGEH